MAVIRVGYVECLTVEDAAHLLEVGTHHVRALVRRRKLFRQGLTSPMLIARASVEEYRRTRGVWNPGGVRGGKPAALRMGSR